jgi:hypothetical protein
MDARRFSQGRTPATVQATGPEDTTVGIRFTRGIATLTIAIAAGFGLSACSVGAPVAPDKGSAQDAQREPLTVQNFVERASHAQSEAKSMHFTMTGSAQGLAMELTGQVRADEDPMKTAVVMSGDVAGTPLEIRFVEGVMYLNMGELTGGKFATGGSSPLDSLGGVDLSSQLDAFDAALIACEQDGEEKIDGVDTTRFVLTLDPVKMAEATGTPVPEGTPETVTAELFVDRDDLPRRLVMDMGTVTMEQNFSKWGEPVTIEAPAADEILEPTPAA